MINRRALDLDAQRRGSAAAERSEAVPLEPLVGRQDQVLYGQKGTIMNSQVLLKLYLIISGGVFFIVGIFHLLRLIYQWPIVVGSTTIPFLLSYAGLPEAIVASLLAFWLLRKGVR